jgi:hypothetical protein
MSIFEVWVIVLLVFLLLLLFEVITNVATLLFDCEFNETVMNLQVYGLTSFHTLRLVAFRPRLISTYQRTASYYFIVITATTTKMT